MIVERAGKRRDMAGRAAAGRQRPAAAAPTVRRATAARFLSVQAVNARRDAAVARPFREDEFGTGQERPSVAHIRAANDLIARLRRRLAALADGVARSAAHAATDPTPSALRGVVERKGRAGAPVRAVEGVWRYYYQLFGQRGTRFGPLLQATDRIALDCYQAVYTGLGRARSVPTPPPLSYMASSRTPSTFRRGVRVSHLGRLPNPFPIVQLPIHRLANPWTLGAVHHEVSHNLQSDLGLWEVVPRHVGHALRRGGFGDEVARTWMRWHKEIWADLCGVLLGGPSIVRSLMDVVARGRRATVRFGPNDVHPSPYLRVLINLELLRRLGFGEEAARVDRLWRTLYAPPASGEIPRALVATFPRAVGHVVDLMCFQPYGELGGKALADTVRFTAEHEAMTAEAAARLAEGVDPGILPARFLVGAVRVALERGLAPPETLARRFYDALGAR